MDVLAHLRGVLDVDIAAPAFFADATIAGLAEKVERVSPGLAGASG